MLAPGGAEARARCVQSEVEFRDVRDDEVEPFLDVEEWSDKAGGYAIQETADAFVENLEGGGFDNVVGLPVALALGLLAALDPPA
ncbi:MAG: hypothetical protein CMJ98_13390 [Planctomycetes bacterium]|nr:hypothetical protein [Planctomycetota bacterium]